MSRTINKTYDDQIIGGTFSNQEDADEAVEAFENLDISLEDIQVVVRLNEKQARESNRELLLESGFSEGHAAYYDELVRQGHILVAIHGVTDPVPIIEIFDQYDAEYNPNGSRNLRDDVLGMTAGAMVGSVALGALGAVVAGPVGAAAGGVAGALVGGGSGAAAGKAVEQKK